MNFTGLLASVVIFMRWVFIINAQHDNVHMTSLTILILNNLTRRKLFKNFDNVVDLKVDIKFEIETVMKLRGV